MGTNVPCIIQVGPHRSGYRAFIHGLVGIGGEEPGWSGATREAAVEEAMKAVTGMLARRREEVVVHDLDAEQIARTFALLQDPVTAIGVLEARARPR